MADFVPRFDPGDKITYTTSAAVTGGQPVEITGARTVANTTAASAKIVGVAMFDAASGASVSVVDEGVFDLVASAAIAAGALVETTAAGKVVTWAGTVVTQIFGIALTAASANGDVIQVKRG